VDGTEGQEQITEFAIRREAAHVSGCARHWPGTRMGAANEPKKECRHQTRRWTHGFIVAVDRIHLFIDPLLAFPIASAKAGQGATRHRRDQASKRAIWPTPRRAILLARSHRREDRGCAPQSLTESRGVPPRRLHVPDTASRRHK